MKRNTTRLNRSNRSVPAKNSSCVTLKDLCQQDKEKVKKLVQDLAIVGTEKEEIDQVRKREKYEYNTKLQNLHEQQTKLSEENKILEESLKTYQQKFKEIQELHKATEQSQPTTSLHQNDLVNPPYYYGPHPIAVPSLQQPAHLPNQSQSTTHHDYRNQNVLHSSLFPPTPYYPVPPTLNYNSFPPNLPVYPFKHQSPWIQQTHITQPNEYQNLTANGIPHISEGNKQIPNGHGVLTNTWCTLPESESIAEVSPLLEPYVNDEECYKEMNHDPINSMIDGANDNSSLSHEDGITESSEDTKVSQTAVPGNLKIVCTQTTSTQTDDTPLIDESTKSHVQSGNTVTASVVVEQSNNRLPNEVHSLAHNGSVIHGQPTVTHLHHSTVDNEQLKEAELLSIILNQTLTTGTVSCLDDIAMSLLDNNNYQYNNSININNDDEKILQEIFYI